MSDNEDQLVPLTDEEVEALNDEADRLWEAVEETNKEVTRMADTVKALPNLNRLIMIAREHMQQDMLHRVVQHSANPVVAAEELTEEYFARVFLTGYHFARAGHTIMEVDGVVDDEEQKASPDKADWN